MFEDPPVLVLLDAVSIDKAPTLPSAPNFIPEMIVNASPVPLLSKPEDVVKGLPLFSEDHVLKFIVPLLLPLPRLSFRFIRPLTPLVPPSTVFALINPEIQLCMC